MKGILNILKGVLVFYLTFMFVKWFIKGLFHPKWWWVYWIWFLVAFLQYSTYESTWPK